MFQERPGKSWLPGCTLYRHSYALVGGKKIDDHSEADPFFFTVLGTRSLLISATALLIPRLIWVESTRVARLIICPPFYVH